MSLISNLHQIIKDRNGGVFTQNELEAYCHSAQYKLSNAERRLRPSESPNIERVMKNGAIVGYQWKAPPKDDWCNKCGNWLNHDRNCETLKVEVNTLF